MRLTRFGVHRYRRFADRSEMDVDSAVLAIVGPNESGKTSLLRALAHLNGSQAFHLSGEGREITRGHDVNEGDQVVWARFLLEEADIAELSDIPEAKSSRWFVIEKRADGGLRYWMDPRPLRNRRPRKRVLTQLQRLQKSGRNLNERVSLQGRDLNSELASAIEVVSITDDTLTEGALGRLLAFTSGFSLYPEEGDSRYLRELPEALRQLIKLEEAEPPSTRASGKLWRRRPEFLVFDDEARTLNSGYELIEVASDPPTALRNLSALAGLDLRELLSAVTEGDHGRAEALVERANEELTSQLDAWKQAGVSLRLQRDGTYLRLLVRTVDGYESVAERSDGLRWFVSLLAFTAARESDSLPILLVDEAESHLHYDAQADLVRVFRKQTAVAKVIYTTHSAGCLPEDLGTGVRVVVPDEDTGTSRIQNWFWEESAGYSPLLLGMGASALAFRSLRRAVFVEGPTDLILLPTMLREVAGPGDIGFQVVPGLAQLAQEDVAASALEASMIVYLVDSDAGGKKIGRILKSAGVPSDRIIELADGSKRGLTLEDFVDDQTYAWALSEEFRRSGNEVQFPVSALPVSGRLAFVKQWCAERNVSVPKKRSVAHRALERRHGGIVAGRRKRGLRGVYAAVQKVLDLGS